MSRNTASTTPASNEPVSGTPAANPDGPRGSAPPPGISGKKITLAMVLAMLVVGGFLGYALWTYSRLDAARAETANAWRELTSELDRRYQAAERLVLGTDEAPWASDEFRQQFRMALDSFRTTSQITNQQRAAELLESLLASGEASAEATFPVDRSLRQAVEEFNARRQKEEQILGTLGGQSLDLFLGFSEPKRFELAE